MQSCDWHEPGVVLDWRSFLYAGRVVKYPYLYRTGLAVTQGQIARKCRKKFIFDPRVVLLIMGIKGLRNALQTNQLRPAHVSLQLCLLQLSVNFPKWSGGRIREPDSRC